MSPWVCACKQKKKGRVGREGSEKGRRGRRRDAREHQSSALRARATCPPTSLLRLLRVRAMTWAWTNSFRARMRSRSALFVNCPTSSSGDTLASRMLVVPSDRPAVKHNIRVLEWAMTHWTSRVGYHINSEATTCSTSFSLVGGGYRDITSRSRSTSTSSRTCSWTSTASLMADMG